MQEYEGGGEISRGGQYGGACWSSRYIRGSEDWHLLQMWACVYLKNISLRVTKDSTALRKLMMTGTGN